MIYQHKSKMREVQSQIEQATGKRRLQLIKHYHKMRKELLKAEHTFRGGTWLNQ